MLPNALSVVPFEIDHVIPQKHGGTTVEENLALACFYCNRYKGPNIAGFDPQSRQLSRLFNPRHDIWDQHFEWTSNRIEGLTATGRATVEVLRLNHSEMLTVREALREEGVFPF